MAVDEVRSQQHGLQVAVQSGLVEAQQYGIQVAIQGATFVHQHGVQVAIQPPKLTPTLKLRYINDTFSIDEWRYVVPVIVDPSGSCWATFANEDGELYMQKLEE